MMTVGSITALHGVARHDATQFEHWGVPSHVVAGRPDTRGLNAFASADGAFSAGIWECSPGKWRVHYAEDELSFLLSGRLVVTDAAGAQRTFAAGDAFVMPAGFLGTLEVVETVRKVYAMYGTSAA